MLKRPKSRVDDDAAAAARFGRVGGEGLVGYEVAIALDGEAEFAADGGELE
jgi:hypothetical protein